MLTWCAGHVASTPSAALQAGASGASGVFIEMRGTLVLDDGVDRKKVTRKLHNASVFLFGLFRQPRWGLFLWVISAKRNKVFKLKWLLWRWVALTSDLFQIWLPWCQMWLHNFLFYEFWHSGLSTGCRRKQEQVNFGAKAQSVRVYIPPPPSLQHNPGATSHTLGLPVAPGPTRGAANPRTSAQNVRLITEILNDLSPSSCGGSRFVVAVMQLW